VQSCAANTVLPCWFVVARPRRAVPYARRLCPRHADGAPGARRGPAPAAGLSARGRAGDPRVRPVVPRAPGHERAALSACERPRPDRCRVTRVHGVRAQRGRRAGQDQPVLCRGLLERMHPRIARCCLRRVCLLSAGPATAVHVRASGLSLRCGAATVARSPDVVPIIRIPPGGRRPACRRAWWGLGCILPTWETGSAGRACDKIQ
jgi:hypothetical protein